MPFNIPDLPDYLLQWLWIGLISILLSFLIFILVWWSVFSKAGFSGARSLLLLIPIVNVIIFLIFAFGEWPVHRDLDALQQENDVLRQQLAAIQQGQQFAAMQQGQMFGSNPNYPAVPYGYPANQNPQYNSPQQHPFNQQYH
jgi:hypothetical protein